MRSLKKIILILLAISLVFPAGLNAKTITLTLEEIIANCDEIIAECHEWEKIATAKIRTEEELAQAKSDLERVKEIEDYCVAKALLAHLNRLDAEKKWQERNKKNREFFEPVINYFSKS